MFAFVGSFYQTPSRLESGILEDFENKHGDHSHIRETLEKYFPE